MRTVKTGGHVTCDRQLRCRAEAVLGYWDDFVLSSQPFWEDWIEEAGEPLLQPAFLDDSDDDEEDNPDKIADEEDDRSSAFLFLEPPEDVYNAEFMDAMMRIIPVA